MSSHIGHISWSFLRCVFSSVSLTCLPERMHSHSHAGSNCLTFPQSAVSNVSNCLPERMHKHTGCICLAFLRRVFSQGTWIKTWINLTACICLTFLHCEYLCVYQASDILNLQSSILSSITTDWGEGKGGGLDLSPSDLSWTLIEDCYEICLCFEADFDESESVIEDLTKIANLSYQKAKS